MNGFVIKKVRYNDNEKKDYITHLMMGNFMSADESTIDNLGILASWEKRQVIDMVTDTPIKTNVFTALNEGDEDVLGARVEAYPYDEPRFLRTVGNTTEEDNLGELPTY